MGPGLSHPRRTLGYMYLHFEAVLVNLLEGVMFNEDAVEALGDLTLELCDYCHRKTLYLNAIPGHGPASRGLNAWLPVAQSLWWCTLRQWLCKNVGSPIVIG